MSRLANTLPTPRRRARGFTLIEIMVAIALTAVLVLGLVELFVTTTRTARATNSIMEVQDNGRTAMQLISADIRRLGYFAGLLDLTLVAGSSAISDVSADACPDPVTKPSERTDFAFGLNQPIFGLDDPSSFLNFTCLSAGTGPGDHLRDDVLLLRYTPSVPVAAGDMVAGRPYMRTGLRSNRGAVFLGSAEGNSDNDVSDATAEAFPLVAHAYYVGVSDRDCEGVDTPSLFRMSIADNGEPEAQELIPGVERFQVRYLEGDRYQSASGVTNWDNVTAVEVQLLVRTTCPESGYTSDKTFTLGGTISPAYPATPDSFRRQLFTSVINIRNRG